MYKLFNSSYVLKRMLLLVAVILCFQGLRITWQVNSRNRQNQNTSIETEPVRRTMIDVSVNAPGEIQSANNTVVECEIERLSLVVRGNSITSSGSTRILKLIPDGSIVKKDDVLCLLDSTEFEEMSRLQRINVERAKSDKLQAEMELEVAKISLEEYRNGLSKQQSQTLRGQIALALTDSSKITGRLEWSRKMLQKGYLSLAAIRLEEVALQRSDIQLTQAQLALKTYEKYSKPIAEHGLAAKITSLKTTLESEASRLTRHQDRLKNYEKQIAKCTIRSPNNGMVIYANEPDGDSRIEEGSDVRQGQDMFYIPELDNLQVMSKLSESIVQKVQTGMKVRVLVEALGGREFEGHVERIAQLPIPPSSWRMAQDVKNYLCVVKIDGKPTTLRPGLNAEIQVITDSDVNSLTISPEVVVVEKDQEFCFVAKPDGHYEKREIRTRTGDPATLEIIEGLTEGESIVRKPKVLEDQQELIDTVVLLETTSNLQDLHPSLQTHPDQPNNSPEFDPAQISPEVLPTGN